jgi:DNA-binding LacI/PurR family transcriptional regulator
LRLLLKHRVPVSVLGVMEGLRANRAEIAMREFARDVTARGLLAKGYRKIALITRGGEVLASRIAREQEAGFREALDGAGLARDEQIVRTCEEKRESAWLGWETAQGLWEEHGPLESFLVGNDLIAQGVLFFCHQKGIQFGPHPEMPGPQVSVVSLAGTTFPPFLPEAYSSAILPIGECGAGLADLVADELETGRDWVRRLWRYHPCQESHFPVEGPEGKRKWNEVVREEILLGDFTEKDKERRKGVVKAEQSVTGVARE